MIRASSSLKRLSIYIVTFLCSVARPSTYESCGDMIQSINTANSVQFSHSVVSDPLRPCGLQHARPPCPSPTLRAYSNMFIMSVMPSNHLILCRPLLLLPSIFPSIRVFSNGSGGRSIGVSASTSVLPMNLQD